MMSDSATLPSTWPPEAKVCPVILFQLDIRQQLPDLGGRRPPTGNLAGFGTSKNFMEWRSEMCFRIAGQLHGKRRSGREQQIDGRQFQPAGK